MALRQWLASWVAPAEPAQALRPRPLINLEEARARHVGAEVPSPCIGVCQLNEVTMLCSGCYRTLDEIGHWAVLDDAERLVVWQQVEARQPVRD